MLNKSIPIFILVAILMFSCGATPTAGDSETNLGDSGFASIVQPEDIFEGHTQGGSGAIASNPLISPCDRTLSPTSFDLKMTLEQFSGTTLDTDDDLEIDTLVFNPQGGKKITARFRIEGNLSLPANITNLVGVIVHLDQPSPDLIDNIDENYISFPEDNVIEVCVSQKDPACLPLVEGENFFIFNYTDLDNTLHCTPEAGGFFLNRLK